MERVFLSHSSKDKHLVSYVAEKLGDGCVIDEQSFLPGCRTINEIVTTLNDCDLFVIFLSDKALDSDWVQNELRMAVDRFDNKSIKICAFIIDKKINYYDVRIPELLRKQYNLRRITNPDIIVARIRDEIRDIKLQRNTRLSSVSSLFIGRRELMAKADNDFGNLEGRIPTYIVANNYYSGIGRRKLLNEILRDHNFIRGYQRPVEIGLASTDSIETFILKLNGYLFSKDPSEIDLADLSMETKVALTVSLVKEYKKNATIISIIDSGAIVLPNHKIADWFVKVASDAYFENKLTFCIVSQFMPYERYMEYPLGFAYHVDELNRMETQNLFMQLLNKYGKREMHVAVKEQFINALSGNPSQIIYVVKQICNHGETYALSHLPETGSRLDSYSEMLLQELQEYPLAYDIAILLSKDTVISFSVIEEVFGDNTADNGELYAALAHMQELSAICLNSGSQYLMLNTSLADYILRQRLVLSAPYKSRYDQMVQANMKRTLDSLVTEDYSKFGAVINEKIARGEKIPEKYFLPSLILNFVLNEYYLGHYDKVEQLCQELLKNQNSDSKVRWDIYYLLARVYARKADERFWHVIKNDDFRLSYTDSMFLQGFFYRHAKDYHRALECYLAIIENNPDHKRTLRELALTYNVMDEYDKALAFARESYERYSTDVMVIQAYFVAIIRRKQFDKSHDRELLQTLIGQIQSSSQSRAEDVARCVEGEYAYYVEGNIDKAEHILQDAVRLNEDRHYPLRALRRIYNKALRFDDAREISRQLDQM